ncbi:MAG: hypothetical protein ACYC48_00120 [Minisyncoccota bacterium]
MKKIILGIGIVVVLGLFVLAYQLTAPSSQSPATGSPATEKENVGLPSAPSAIQATSSVSSLEAGMSIAGSGGGAIQTLNFISNPTTVKDPINPGFYYLGYHQYEGVPDPTVTTDPPYVVAYESDTQFFNIALLQEPIGPVRGEMEQYLMTQLGITQAQMCQLNYMVSVPYRVNSQFSGMNLGFSFCPGAVVLPK